MAIFGDRVVALFDGLIYEVLDGVAGHRVDDADNELPRQTMNITFLRQVLRNSAVLLGFFQEIFYTQALVKRSVQDFDVCGLDIYTKFTLAGIRMLLMQVNHASISPLTRSHSYAE